MGKYFQVIDGKTYASVLTKFKHSLNKAGEKIMPIHDNKNINLSIKNNKILFFQPLKEIKGKDSKKVVYSSTIEKMNCRFILHKGEFYGKIDKNGKPSEKWVKFNDFKPYFRAFELYKQNCPMRQQDLEIALDIDDEKESQDEIKEKDTKAPVESEKKNADE